MLVYTNAPEKHFPRRIGEILFDYLSKSNDLLPENYRKFKLLTSKSEKGGEA